MLLLRRLNRFVAAGMAMALLLAFCGITIAAPPAEEKTPAVKRDRPQSFMRVQRNAEGKPGSLQTAIVRYVPASGEGDLVVDLVSVVHVGDREYYQKLNKEFEQYDALLYELVAPQGTKIPKGGRRDTDNPLAMVQKLMKMVMRLDSQLEHIDYTKKNFVHADLSPEQMAEKIRERGDDGMTLLLGITADLLRQQNLRELNATRNPPATTEEAVDPFALLFDPAGAVKMKQMMAEQFVAADNPAAGLGNTINTILIADRNKAAIGVFQKELAKGKKRIGIFYGAAHMPDFARRLKAEFGLKRDRVRWLTAWDLSAPKRSGLDELFELLAPPR